MTHKDEILTTGLFAGKGPALEVDPRIPLILQLNNSVALSKSPALNKYEGERYLACYCLRYLTSHRLVLCLSSALSFSAWLLGTSSQHTLAKFWFVTRATKPYLEFWVYFSKHYFWRVPTLSTIFLSAEVKAAINELASTTFSFILLGNCRPRARYVLGGVGICL